MRNEISNTAPKTNRPTTEQTEGVFAFGQHNLQPKAQNSGLTSVQNRPSSRTLVRDATFANGTNANRTPSLRMGIQATANTIEGKSSSDGDNSGTLSSSEESVANGSSLLSRNIVVAGKRTSIRLEALMWKALEEICQRERCSMNEVCTYIKVTCDCSSFTASVRVFAVSYFRDAATERGHLSVGHGSGLGAST